MSEFNDGGPAFPWGEHGTHLGGMTLRDYFAAKELSKVEAVSVCALPSDYDRFADHCYRMADAMLRAQGATIAYYLTMESAPLTREILIYDDDLDWQIAWMDEGYWASAEGQLLNPRCWMEKPAKP